MLYPFMTLNDGTEIVHSETIETAGKEKVEVRIEKPVYGGFHSATCWLPEYKWENIDGFSRVIRVGCAHYLAVSTRRWY